MSSGTAGGTNGANPTSTPLTAFDILRGLSSESSPKTTSTSFYSGAARANAGAGAGARGAGGLGSSDRDSRLHHSRLPPRHAAAAAAASTSAVPPSSSSTTGDRTTPNRGYNNPMPLYDMLREVLQHKAAASSSVPHQPQPRHGASAAFSPHHSEDEDEDEEDEEVAASTQTTQTSHYTEEEETTEDDDEEDDDEDDDTRKEADAYRYPWTALQQKNKLSAAAAAAAAAVEAAERRAKASAAAARASSQFFSSDETTKTNVNNPIYNSTNISASRSGDRSSTDKLFEDYFSRFPVRKFGDTINNNSNPNINRTTTTNTNEKDKSEEAQKQPTTRSFPSPPPRSNAYQQTTTSATTATTTTTTNNNNNNNDDDDHDHDDDDDVPTNRFSAYPPPRSFFGSSSASRTATGWQGRNMHRPSANAHTFDAEGKEKLDNAEKQRNSAAADHKRLYSFHSTSSSSSASTIENHYFHTEDNDDDDDDDDEDDHDDEEDETDDIDESIELEHKDDDDDDDDDSDEDSDEEDADGAAARRNRVLDLYNLRVLLQQLKGELPFSKPAAVNPVNHNAAATVHLLFTKDSNKDKDNNAVKARLAVGVSHEDEDEDEDEDGRPKKKTRGDEGTRAVDSLMTSGAGGNAGKLVEPAASAASAISFDDLDMSFKLLQACLETCECVWRLTPHIPLAKRELPLQEEVRQVSQLRDAVLQRELCLRQSPPTNVPSLQAIEEASVLRVFQQAILQQTHPIMPLFAPIHDRQKFIEGKTNLLEQRRATLHSKQREIDTTRAGQVHALSAVNGLRRRLADLTAQNERLRSQHTSLKKVVDLKAAEDCDLYDAVKDWEWFLKEHERRLEKAEALQTQVEQCLEAERVQWDAIHSVKLPPSLTITSSGTTINGGFPFTTTATTTTNNNDNDNNNNNNNNNNDNDATSSSWMKSSGISGMFTGHK